MKKKQRSAIDTLAAFITLLVSWILVSTTLLGLNLDSPAAADGRQGFQKKLQRFKSTNTARFVKLATNLDQSVSPRQLSMADRVAYQYAIEEVYWRHRMWPKENAKPKPSLDEIVSPVQIQEKVKDYLRNSQLLSDQWQRPITPEQLQAEMERMASQTKQAEVLQELVAALRNDPLLVAECLARPVLAERLVRELYAHDEKLHGRLERQAENDLRAVESVEDMKRTSAVYSEIEWIRSDTVDSASGTTGAVRMTTGEWEETIQKLATQFEGQETVRELSRLSEQISAEGTSALQRTGVNRNNASAELLARIRTGVLSRLQEDNARYYATAVLEKGPDRLKVATISWQKVPFELWARAAENEPRETLVELSADYALPQIAISSTGCASDSWTATTGAPDGRYSHTSVWTGSEMIIWGGNNGLGSNLDSGGRYTPSTDSWVATNSSGAPAARQTHASVWTGSEMIVWGGSDRLDSYLDNGARYNPSTDGWVAISLSGAPAARGGHTAVWTGSEMIVWGGRGGPFLNSGGRYNPGTNSWIATSTSGAPAARSAHTAVWTGSEMIVWGGGTDGYFNSGGRYNPNTDSWIATRVTGAPAARFGNTTVWTGSEMIVWGGFDGSGFLNSGGRYNPGTDNWVATSMTGAPTARSNHTAVSTGSEMIIWGGDDGVTSGGSGGRYDSSTDSWVATNSNGAPGRRSRHSAVWTGSEMIVWGGNDGTFVNSGGRYNPSTDSWVPTSTGSGPVARAGHTAVWTGSEMIVWGGYRVGSLFETGGRYDPSTNSWLATSTNSGPAARARHTAVWTGSEMIVWGGFDGGGYTNSGGRYNPSADSWVATGMDDVPSGRADHTAVWTGSEMVVWGGDDGSFFNSGGRYSPSTDSWVATITSGAPDPRGIHTAVWTGNEMIVWGGYDGVSYFDNGGRYNPSTDSWVATSTSSAPAERFHHTAVWTGSEMIAWGGFGFTATFNSGGRYSPSTDSWVAISTSNAPTGRSSHTAIWADSEMIVWGGHGNTVLNDGARYNPSTDSWVATRVNGAPAARDRHTAVWMGGEMIVWGGFADGLTVLDSGGRYCPGPIPTPTPTPTPTTAQAVNVSTRMLVETGNNVLIGGFIVTGTAPKNVAVRGIGPSLGGLGIPNALADPTLELRGSSGALIRANDDWQSDPTQAAQLTDLGLALQDPKESGLVSTVQPGSYTAILSGSNQTTGVGLVEIYDTNSEANSQLANISTRGRVLTGSNVMIGGFILGGSSNTHVVVRGIGPSLAQFGIPDFLADPTLELHDSNGALLVSNDNWQDDAISASQLTALGLAPQNAAESGVYRSLAPGAFTAILAGANSGTGIGLVEIYNVH